MLRRTIDHDDDENAEAWLHRQFSSFRITGEWFRFHDTMMTIEVPPDFFFAIQPTDVADETPDWLPTRWSTPRRERSKLDQFLEDNGITRVSFAKRLGVYQSYVAETCCGQYGLPSPEIIGRIERETGGAVTAAAFRPGALRVANNNPKRTGFGFSQRAQEAARFVLAHGASPP